MKRHIQLFGLLTAGIFSNLVFMAQADDIAAVPEPAKQMISATKTEREQALTSLTAKQVEIRRQLLANLAEASDKNKGDRSYFSPLHCVILAVEACRVFEADESLLPLADYTLDVASFPEGINVGGDAFYPAASALVELRVETNKVVAALQKSKKHRQVRLLTWVLYRRAGTVDAAKSVLENVRKDGDKSGKLGEAVKLLEQFAKSPEDLLSEVPK